MRLSFIKSCLLALATISGATAQTAGFDVFSSPATGSDLTLTPGSTFTIKWTPSAPAGNVSLILLQGATNLTLDLGPTIASGIDSTKGSYDWTVPTGTFAVYGFKLQLDATPSTFQYSPPFKITGASTTQTIRVSQVSTIASSTATSSTSAPASSTSASSSASSASSTITVASSSSSTAATTGTAASTTLATTTSSRASSSTSAAATATPTGGAMRTASVGTGIMATIILAIGMLL